MQTDQFCALIKNAGELQLRMTRNKPKNSLGVFSYLTFLFAFFKLSRYACEAWKKQTLTLLGQSKKIHFGIRIFPSATFWRYDRSLVWENTTQTLRSNKEVLLGFL